MILYHARKRQKQKGNPVDTHCGPE